MNLGHDDWRLPSIKELSTLVDSNRPPIPQLIRLFSPVASGYWSSTTFAYNTVFAWTCTSPTATSASTTKASNYYVRAVRGNPLPANNFIDNNDGTITDTATGLMWQKATAPGTYTWQQALAYCEDLTTLRAHRLAPAGQKRTAVNCGLQPL